jgi:Holliday junction DNA helicase RuvB
LHDRFGIRARLDYYKADNITEIVNRSARILEVEIQDKAAGLGARGARGTPRVANRILRRMRDFAQVWADGRISLEIVRRGLASLEIDEKGLDKLDRDILRSIILKYGGGPVGCETLAISVGESVETIEDVYEPYLIQTGFLMRTPRGRMVTDNAYRHLKLTKKNNEDQRLLF